MISFPVAEAHVLPAAEDSSGVDGQRVTLRHVSNRPSPNVSFICFSAEEWLLSLLEEANPLHTLVACIYPREDDTLKGP